jgi:hypothetical protein
MRIKTLEVVDYSYKKAIQLWLCDALRICVHNASTDQWGHYLKRDALRICIRNASTDQWSHYLKCDGLRICIRNASTDQRSHYLKCDALWICISNASTDQRSHYLKHDALRICIRNASTDQWGHYLSAKDEQKAVYNFWFVWSIFIWPIFSDYTSEILNVCKSQSQCWNLLMLEQKYY